nr:PfaD family polyunsaturated fatty acid/polyketide biosynthesis protein [Zavarzinella formosa]
MTGRWIAGSGAASGDTNKIQDALNDLSRSVVLVDTAKGMALGSDGHLAFGSSPDGLPAKAILPPLPPGNLGDANFRRSQGLKFNYVTGAMANGIASADIVEEMGRAGMLGFFGAAGLSLERIDAAIIRIQQNLGSLPYGVNLIHSPNEQDHESATVDLLLKRRVQFVEASAFLDLTPHVARYRLSGIHRDATGAIVTPNRVMAKVSRVEVAQKFLSPVSDRILRELVSQKALTEAQAELAKLVPLADDCTVEADSGGHTDNRPAITLLPTILALRDRLQGEFRYQSPVRVGLGGGIATPASAAAAFAMGAAYVVTGSINQACRESGSSDIVRQMLAEAGQADVTMAPAADMFEMGVKVQVLKRGTMFAMRGAKLYELYRAYPSMEAIPAAERVQIEKNLFRFPLEEIWNQTRDYFSKRDPGQIGKADADPKHKMALVFRWYLGQASRWANAGVPDRKVDYQVWCGPAMGAFNEWTKGSFLEAAAERRVVTVALNILHGAALILRRQQLRWQGVTEFDDLIDTRPKTREELEQKMATGHPH